jgi:hypothetical protein
MTSAAYNYGVHSALRIILDPHTEDNVLSTVSIDGFKVTLIASKYFTALVKNLEEI